MQRVLCDKNVYLYGMGRYQKDFEYVFDNLNIKSYLGCSEDMAEVLHGEDSDKAFVIVCEEYSEQRDSEMKALNGCRGKNYCFAEELFKELDFDFQKVVNGRKLCLWSDALFIDREPDYYLDASPERHHEKFRSGNIMHPDEIQDWSDVFCIIMPKKAEGIKEALCQKGLKENTDFVHYSVSEARDCVIPKNKKLAIWGIGKIATRFFQERDALQRLNIERVIRTQEDFTSDCNPREFFVIVDGMYANKHSALVECGFVESVDFMHRELLERFERERPSELMRQVIMAQPVDQPLCNNPFTYASVTSDGNLYCCCPAWPKLSFGNIKYSSCNDVWNGIYAKIFRLSIINRTYIFCNHHVCTKCNADNVPLEKESRFEQLEAKESPSFLEPSIDGTCNLYCESCRECLQVATGETLKEAEFLSRRIKQENWIEKADILQVAGYGEVFASRVYQDLIYNVNQKCNTISVYSNGILFNADRFEKLVDRYRKIHVEISIDAACEKTYAKLRRGGRFDILLENLKYLGEQRRKGKLHYFKINMTVQRDNYLEIPDFIKLGKSINADYIGIRPLRNWGTYKESEFENISMCDENSGWIADELKEVLRNPLLSEKEVDYIWYKKRM